MKTALLMLAAGNSKRFGGIKQLADIQGQPMLCYCLDQYKHNENWLAGIDVTYVVLGANAASIKKILSRDVNVVIASSWQQGMGSSLAQAMCALANDISHVFITLADQVALSPTTLENLLIQSKQAPEKIIAASYRNQQISSELGVPVIFPRHYFADLVRLSGDRGAKGLLKENLDNVLAVPLPSAECDIDTPQDLARYRAVLSLL